MVNDANKRFNLGGGGKKGSREQKKISVSTICSYVAQGSFGVSPKNTIGSI
jgi:hypothetical protein